MRARTSLESAEYLAPSGIDTRTVQPIGSPCTELSWPTKIMYILLRNTQCFWQLHTPLTVIFTRAAHEPAHNTCHGPLSKKVDAPGLKSPRRVSVRGSELVRLTVLCTVAPYIAHAGNLRDMTGIWCKGRVCNRTGHEGPRKE